MLSVLTAVQEWTGRKVRKMTEYERGFIDGIKSKVSAELTPTLINVSKTMLEMLKPVLSTALENVLNDNNAITAADVQPVRHGQWIECCNELDKKCSCCCKVHGTIYEREPFCPNCGAKMDLKYGDTNE